MKGVRNRAQVSNDGKREGGAGSRQLAGAFVPPFPFWDNLASVVPSSPPRSHAIVASVEGEYKYGSTP